MNIKELEIQLDISLHDSLLHAMTTDLARQTADFVLNIWVGDLGATSHRDRERRRVGQLRLTGVQYLVVDPPDPDYRYRLHAPVDIDLCEADPTMTARYPTEDGVFAGRFFVSDWNSFIHFAATSASFSWLEPENAN